MLYIQNWCIYLCIVHYEAVMWPLHRRHEGQYVLSAALVVEVTRPHQHLKPFPPVHLRSTWFGGNLGHVATLSTRSLELETCAKAHFFQEIGLRVRRNFWDEQFYPRFCPRAGIKEFAAKKEKKIAPAEDGFESATSPFSANRIANFMTKSRVVFDIDLMQESPKFTSSPRACL